MPAVTDTDPMGCATNNTRRLLNAGRFTITGLAEQDRMALALVAFHRPAVVGAVCRLMEAARDAKTEVHDIEAGMRAARPILDAAGISESTIEVRSPAARKALAVMAQQDPDVLVGICDLFTAARDAEAVRCSGLEAVL